MELTKEQKTYLAENTCSEKEEDYKAIEKALGSMIYELWDMYTDNRVGFNRHIDEATAKEVLGADYWLVGCERATFHRTAVMNAPDNKYQVHFIYGSFERDNGIPNAKVFYDKHQGVLYAV